MDAFTLLVNNPSISFDEVIAAMPATSDVSSQTDDLDINLRMDIQLGLAIQFTNLWVQSPVWNLEHKYHPPLFLIFQTNLNIFLKPAGRTLT